MLLRDNIYQAIRRSILTCEFEPGQELREQMLAERYRVSRSPIRDSLLRLEQENLVTVLPRQGYRVNPILIPDVEDIFGFRLLIEPACAAGAARSDDTTVRTLDRFLAYNDEALEEQNFIAYNRAFHDAVADMSGNTRMAAVARDLVEQFERLERFSLSDYHLVKVDQVVQEHDAIIEAIKAHDAELAARLAYQHAEAGRSRIIAALEQGAWASAQVPPRAVNGGRR